MTTAEIVNLLTTVGLIGAAIFSLGKFLAARVTQVWQRIEKRMDAGDSVIVTELKQIKEQTTLTNGRVSVLENNERATSVAIARLEGTLYGKSALDVTKEEPK